MSHLSCGMNHHWKVQLQYYEELIYLLVVCNWMSLSLNGVLKLLCGGKIWFDVDTLLMTTSGFSID